eukprot:gnl/TRDRNA2_/TRDRNA2_157690_c0_seq1.p1 gnl/TRDRNA2_/TRDRNA2_157690_c0~~gnl/TRDRNA2_/TRDRNA2_157690_c0_seq1.p1  ORF type:complete len:804 (-),score=145.12 gnl/TRDRNA2_/TRDRNA2_157690_c0_seq1:52-2463(-)
MLGGLLHHLKPKTLAEEEEARRAKRDGAVVTALSQLVEKKKQQSSARADSDGGFDTSSQRYGRPLSGGGSRGQKDAPMSMSALHAQFAGGAGGFDEGRQLTPPDSWQPRSLRRDKSPARIQQKSTTESTGMGFTNGPGQRWLRDQDGLNDCSPQSEANAPAETWTCGVCSQRGLTGSYCTVCQRPRGTAINRSYQTVDEMTQSVIDGIITAQRAAPRPGKRNAEPRQPRVQQSAQQFQQTAPQLQQSQPRLQQSAQQFQPSVPHFQQSMPQLRSGPGATSPAALRSGSMSTPTPAPAPMPYECERSIRELEATLGQPFPNTRMASTGMDSRRHELEATLGETFTIPPDPRHARTETSAFRKGDRGTEARRVQFSQTHSVWPSEEQGPVQKQPNRWLEKQRPPAPQLPQFPASLPGSEKPVQQQKSVPNGGGSSSSAAPAAPQEQRRPSREKEKEIEGLYAKFASVPPPPMPVGWNNTRRNNAEPGPPSHLWKDPGGITSPTQGLGSSASAPSLPSVPPAPSPPSLPPAAKRRTPPTGSPTTAGLAPQARADVTVSPTAQRFLFGGTDAGAGPSSGPISSISSPAMQQQAQTAPSPAGRPIPREPSGLPPARPVPPEPSGPAPSRPMPREPPREPSLQPPARPAPREQSAPAPARSVPRELPREQSVPTPACPAPREPAMPQTAARPGSRNGEVPAAAPAPREVKAKVDAFHVDEELAPPQRRMQTVDGGSSESSSPELRRVKPRQPTEARMRRVASTPVLRNKAEAQAGGRTMGGEDPLMALLQANMSKLDNLQSDITSRGFV